MEKMVMQAQFWNGKRVFVTGHTGFKGSWLTLLLTRLGAEVTGYALAPSTQPSLFDVARVEPLTKKSITGDIRDAAALKRALLQSGAEIVLHLAAQSLVKPSYADPVTTYETNVMGTVNVLEAIRDVATVGAAVIVTSDKCYDNREWLWGYREDEAMGGYDPYSSSKGCAELVTAAYRRSFFKGASASGRHVGIASARAGNVVGGGDWARDRLVPDLIAAFSERRAALIRNPDAVRPWQYVLEPLAGYLTLAHKLALEPEVYEGAWNFGPGEEDVRAVSWVADRLALNWAESASWILDENSHPHEAHLLKLDSSKARTLLGWRPRLGLERGLTWITQWHRAHLKGEDMQRFTSAQIHRYLEEVSS